MCDKQILKLDESGKYCLSVSKKIIKKKCIIDNWMKSNGLSLNYLNSPTSLLQPNIK